MNNTSRVAATLLTAAIGSILTSCAAADPAATSGPVATHHNTSSQTGATSPAPATSSGPTNPAGAETTKPEDQMRITITIGNQQFQATLDDSAASRDLLAQLPATLRMDDHAGVEKTGTLPTPLSLEGQPAGADPDVGDVGYYAPGNNLVLYYGDMTYYNGIVILGHLDGDAAQRIADLNGSITATVTSSHH